MAPAGAVRVRRAEAGDVPAFAEFRWARASERPEAWASERGGAALSSGPFAARLADGRERTPSSRPTAVAAAERVAP